jgi:hypothetical protein
VGHVGLAADSLEILNQNKDVSLSKIEIRTRKRHSLRPAQWLNFQLSLKLRR